MENPVECFECKGRFENKNRVPLVLKCGDSVCMSCLLEKVSFSSYICKVCLERHMVSFNFIKEMPVNKALLAYIERNFDNDHKNEFKEKSISFDRKVSEFRCNTDDSLIPFIDNEIKCKRKVCHKEKYVYNNVIYEYCSIECYNLDKSENIE